MTCGLANAADSENLRGGHGDVAAVSQQHRTGVIDVYRGESKRVGIDACVVATPAWQMLAAMGGTSAPSLLFVYQSSEGGMVSIDVQVSASVAARMLEAAERAGVVIYR